MEVRSQHFAEGARAALEDPRLQRALGEATGRLRDQRAEAFASFPPGEALRAEARRIKLDVLERLEEHFETFAEHFEARGGVLHRAADAGEARRIIVDLARARGARLAVKSKSMTSEEISLNEALEEAGVETLETDLGEYIIQLAGEAPSHIIVPAIHKSVQEVAELFSEHHGSDSAQRHEALTREARERLREAFLRADVGITGANFAVAETGSLAIVENEGNVRMATSLPRLHIAIMGMEKLVPDLAALSVFLRILARSATGQKMTSYVSLVTGPRRSDEEDGPEELHLVVLDNGRSRMLADPELREALACIRCGACLNACPVYQHAGGHAYGWVYPGPIGAVINPSLVGYEKAGALPFASSLCGACREVCPVGIDLPRLLLAQRARVVESGGESGGRAGRRLVALFASVLARPRLYRLAARLARWASLPWVRGGRIRRLPGLGAWTRTRDLPAPARQSFRERWEKRNG